jgi:hypothetical protein
MSDSTSITFNCSKYDNYLHQVLTTVNASFAAAEATIRYEEIKTVSNQFLYCIKNINNKLEGYIGRDKNTNKVVYIIKDGGKLNWAIKEGLYDNIGKEINNDLDIMRRMKDINSFINFMIGNKNYQFISAEE